MSNPDDDEPEGWCIFYCFEDEEDAVYEQAEHWCCVHLFDDDDDEEGSSPVP